MKLRLGHFLATTTFVAAGIVSACDGDDTMTGGIDASITPDAGKVDQSAPVADAKPDAKPRGNNARLHFVNDNITVDDGFRYCMLAADGATEPTFNDAVDVAPFPSGKLKGAANAGLAMGRVSEAPEILPSYQGKRIKIVAYGVQSLVGLGQDKLNCKALASKSALQLPGDGGLPKDAGADSLFEGYDFSVFDFPAGTFADKKSYVLVTTGCPAGTDPSVLQRCGTDHDNAKGSLGLYVVALDQSEAASGKNHVQAIHAAKRLANSPLGPEPKLDLLLEYPDPGGGDPVLVDVKGLDYTSKTALPVPPVVSPPLAGLEFVYLRASSDLADTMPRVFEVSDVTKADLAAADKKGFTLVVVGSPFGDPEISPGVRNHWYIHAVIVPNE